MKRVIIVEGVMVISSIPQGSPRIQGVSAVSKRTAGGHVARRVLLYVNVNEKPGRLVACRVVSFVPFINVPSED